MSSDVTESAGFYEFLAWLELNKQRLVIGAIALALIAFSVSLIVYLKKQKEIAANAALLELEQSLNPSTSSPAQPAATAYLKVAEDYAGTRAAERAALLAAGALFSENRYAEALAQFRKFQSEHDGSELVPVATLGVAACLESQNQLDEAIKAYEQVVARYPNDAVTGQAKLAIGALQEMKKQPALALKTYEELTRQTTRSVWVSLASDLRKQLLLRHPNLATNAPSAEPPVTALKPPLTTTNQTATNALKPAVKPPETNQSQTITNAPKPTASTPPPTAATHKASP